MQRLLIWLTIAIVVSHLGIGRPQAKIPSWLDEPKPSSWNQPGLRVPAAPKIDGMVDPRCREQARPAQLEEDERVRGAGLGSHRCVSGRLADSRDPWDGRLRWNVPAAPVSRLRLRAWRLRRDALCTTYGQSH